MKNKIFRTVLFTAIIALSVLFFVFTAVFCKVQDRKNKQELKREITLISQTLSFPSQIYNIQISGLKVVLIGTDGTVICDSQSLLEGEDFSGKKEIKNALKNGTYLTTVTENKQKKDCYTINIEGVGVLRGTRKSFGAEDYFSKCWAVVLLYIGLMAISVVIAYFKSKTAVKPLEELNTQGLVDKVEYKELGLVVREMNDRHLQIKLKDAQLQSRNELFKTVITSMNEGLVLLDENKNIEFINISAQTVLGDAKEGDSYLTLKRSEEITSLMQALKASNIEDTIVEEGNFSYQILIKPSKVLGEVKGYVIMVFDVSEKEKSEQMRREFTANVSHELKTPLHSISGCAELLSGGLVKPEDTKQFSNQIYSEAKRMIRLVDDIIKLSSLDEGASEMQREELDLFAIAKETVDNLEMESQTANIKIELSGESAYVFGIKPLLVGIIYNLCDNAIKYNKENGSVRVKIKITDNNVELTVKDNGIGIPADHIPRIFERFYRVDKSHSKEVGGTGLGLSIVKHAVRLHDADISVKSQVGKGTKFTVKFPKR